MCKIPIMLFHYMFVLCTFEYSRERVDINDISFK